MMNPLNRISGAELAVMKILWSADGPVTTGAIYKELRTLLRRLTEKGAVEEKKLEVLCYLPAVSEKDYRDTQTRNFLERLYGGSAKKLVAYLVQSDELTNEDIEELREFLNKGGDGNA